MPQAQLQKAHFDLIDEYSRLLDKESRNRGRFVWAALFASIAIVFALGVFNLNKPAPGSPPIPGSEQTAVHHR